MSLESKETDDKALGLEYDCKDAIARESPQNCESSCAQNMPNLQLLLRFYPPQLRYTSPVSLKRITEPCAQWGFIVQDAIVICGQSFDGGER